MNIHEFASNLKKYRIVSGMTQAELAERLFLAPQTISKWERGVSVPDALKLYEICSILDVKMSTFFNEKDEIGERMMIAIDGGGTKTEFLLFDERGKIRHRVLLGGSNPNACGMKTACQILEEGIGILLSKEKRITHIFAGIAGSATGTNGEVINAFLRKRYPMYPSSVDSDIRNVMGCMKHNSKCIVGIMGTGSVIYAWDGKAMHRAGGWGYLFDNAGSGYDIGRDVLCRCFACEDGMEKPRELVQLAMIKLGESVSESRAQIFSLGKEYVASFAPIAFRAAQVGDPAALEIIEKSADRMAELINFVHKRYDCGNVAALAGSLVAREDLLCNMIKERVDSRIRIEVLKCPQVFGAARRCMELAKISCDYDSFWKNLEHSYEEENEC